MTTTHVVWRLGGLTLAADEAEAIVAADATLLLVTDDGHKVRDAMLELRVDAGTWRQIDEHGLLHLRPDLRGQQLLAFDERSIRIEAGLDPDLYCHLEVLTAPEELCRLPAHHPLLQASSWYGLTVTQGDGRLRTGFRTAWAPEGPFRAHP